MISDNSSTYKSDAEIEYSAFQVWAFQIISDTFLANFRPLPPSDV